MAYVLKNEIFLLRILLIWDVTLHIGINRFGRCGGM